MASYGTPVGERCRFCGLDLPPDAVAVMTHINTHWRQFNLESLTLSPCAFEPQLDIRVGNTPITPEDLEVSTHTEQGFQYTYSPQTEPSNLTINGPRCSPLNLTGRPKSTSPIMSSPLPPPPPPPSITHHHHHQATLGVHPAGLMPNPNNCHHPYSLGMLGTPQPPPNQMQPTVPTPVPQTMNMMPVPHMDPPHHDHHHHPNHHHHHHHHHHNEEDQGLGMMMMKRKRRLALQMDRSQQETRCNMCGRMFYTKASYDEHMDSHMNLKDSGYMMNGQEHGQGQEQGQMETHTQLMSNVMSCAMPPDKPYKCSVCDREFMYKEELQEHTESHEAAKPYKCDICGAGLSHISALRRHRLAHSGYKPHRCEICSRSFFQKCDLQRHYATHGKAKQFQCGVCKKKYSSLHFLENHKCKAPEEPKPFKCNICGEGCANNMAWSYHMWKHTKNPVFVPFQEKFATQTGSC